MRNKPMSLGLLVGGLLGIVIGGAAILVLRPTLLNGPATKAAVRDALRANPEIVLEALQVLQSRRADAERVQRRDSVLAHGDALFNDANSFVAGNPQGDVAVVEFFDYRCPYCRQSLAVVAALIKQDANLRVIYKEYPILGPQSLVAARLAVAARKEPRYEALHEALMMAPGPLDEDTALQIAADVGLDRDAMAVAMKAPDVDEILKANHALARDLGINGTPAFVIGDALVPGVTSLDNLKALVAKVRARGGDSGIKSGS